GLRVTAAEIAAALARTGIAEAAEQPVRQLSAGQRRRVALARVLLGGGALWVLDEPGSNLDAPGRALLQALVAQHLHDGGTAVIATHQGLDLPGGPARSLTLQ
ncbi:MAG: ABC transporter ATP-binding protein, partial [Steroidobacteraceae bacterium]